MKMFWTVQTIKFNFFGHILDHPFCDKFEVCPKIL